MTRFSYSYFCLFDCEQLQVNYFPEGINEVFWFWLLLPVSWNIYYDNCICNVPPQPVSQEGGSVYRSPRALRPQLGLGAVTRQPAAKTRVQQTGPRSAPAPGQCAQAAATAPRGYQDPAGEMGICWLNRFKVKMYTWCRHMLWFFNGIKKVRSVYPVAKPKSVSSQLRSGPEDIMFLWHGFWYVFIFVLYCMYSCYFIFICISSFWAELLGSAKWISVQTDKVVSYPK